MSSPAIAARRRGRAASRPGRHCGAIASRAKNAQRLVAAPGVFEHRPEIGQRLQVLGVVGERAREVDERRLGIAGEIVGVGARRPGLGPLRLQRGQRVEQLLRDLDVLAVERRSGAAEQQIAGVGAGMLIEPVDAGDDAVGFVGVGGDREPRQQGVAPGVLAGVGLGAAAGGGGDAGASAARAARRVPAGRRRRGAADPS